MQIDQMDDVAKFITYNYAETKDLAKAFLPLISAILVASVTFSEKIIDVKNARWSAKALLIACWVVLILALALDGLGLCVISIAAGQAVYDAPNYQDTASTAYWLIVLSGVSFVVGLATLIAAAVIALVRGPKPAPSLPSD